ncbi:MAG: uroporphyrinogen-III C-methyltransferase [Caldilineaceae bacterium]|nr:uroporphyrinogen-III C-methyltransferase [Caldilineaceae bacterium]
MSTSNHTFGKAYLIGAGPGRADLITVRGLRLLRQADVIVYDRLIAQELLDEAHPDAELIFVGKRPHNHALSQDGINRLLVERVRAGQIVVRLKGGDPFVFGRGGEEALALRLAGLPFEIVPGVSSALAVPAYAGVPVTQRGVATSFAVVTGHECDETDAAATDWAALARISTLVILMGVGHIRQIRTALIEAGRAPDTPAIAIAQGTTDQQRSVRSTLADLPSAIEASELQSPATIVIGEVAGMHDFLDWYRPDGEAAGFIEMDELNSMALPIVRSQEEVACYPLR